MRPHGRKLAWPFDPMQLVRQWDTDQSLLLLHSGRPDPRWAKWSIAGLPTATYRFNQDGQSSLSGENMPPIKLTHDPFEDMRTLLSQTGKGLWLGYLGYDLGRWIEQLPDPPKTDRDWPVIELAYCPGYLLFDHHEKHWYACGTWEQPRASLPLNTGMSPSHTDPIRIGKRQSVFDRTRYEQAVRRCIEYIHQGDVFQINLTQRFTVPMQGPTPQTQRHLFEQLMQVSPAWYGAYLELSDHHTIASTSPELFLELDPTGKVTTRPIKGTRPSYTSPNELKNSHKDQAELHMIVDLMRNDLGRVCQCGSIKVPQPRVIETHPTVHHGVATVQGQLAPDKDLVDLLKATVPGGSITGAPKVRAMQIIDELEPVRRGPYCGGIGYLSRDHGCCLNIAIRTMLMKPGSQTGYIDYNVGGGIVADSDPASEYQETLDKAAAIDHVLKTVGLCPHEQTLST